MEQRIDADWLWHEYVRNRCTCHRGQLILVYMPVVRRVSAKVWRRTPIQVELEELVSFGILGLIRAVDVYDPTRGVDFETVAAAHIRGVILDELRKVDWAPRAVRKRQRELDAAIEELEWTLGRIPTSTEVATKLGVSVADVEERRAETSQTRVASLDEHYDNGDYETASQGPEDPSQGLDDQAHTSALYAAAQSALRGMSWSHKMVMALYYFEGLSFSEAASVMGVTENRIADLHNGAVTEVRDSLLRQLDTAAA